METLEENLKKLREISKFGKNWNGYGADPIPETVLKKTEKILRGLKNLPQPFISPIADGFIQLEWEVEGAYLEIVANSTKSSQRSINKLVKSFIELKGE